MGNDGGSIPSRAELVKTKAVPKKVVETANANSEHAWKYCALSRAPLAEPLVSDAFGNMYNKESIIEYMLDNKAFGEATEAIAHITSMKDVVELKIAKDEGKFICEVTRRDMNGQTKFVYPSGCGHAFAAEALKNVHITECLICSKPCSLEDIIPLNPDQKDLEKLKERFARLTESGSTHSGAPQKKKKQKRKAESELADARKTVKQSQSSKVSSHQDNAQSDVLKSLLHKSADRVSRDGFMTRGTSSRVG